VQGRDAFKVSTPFGDCLLSYLDDSKRVLFANRHLCTKTDGNTGEVLYAPPHEVNYRALIWALVVECGCSAGVVAIGSTGTLHPDVIPVGSVVMPDDYYMVVPEPMTFWGERAVGSFDVPAGGIGRIHYSPADPLDTRWVSLRRRVRDTLAPLLGQLPAGRVRLAQHQTPDIWPCVHNVTPGLTAKDSLVYVNTVGPRFETRAEIRAYRGVGDIVGMTCGREWALCEELSVPYCLLCFCDNACNGLSSHPGGALQEYLEHKQSIAEVSGAVVSAMVAALSAS